MDPDLSEFSFGFALASELVARFDLKRAGAPEFATQNAVGKPRGGWDMKLPGVAVYLQFKRSSRMVRRTPPEAVHFRAMPFFRMHLRRRDWSDQHKLMLDLEIDGNQVFYAAPIFDSTEDLSRHYSRDQVMRNSIFIRPSAIGTLKDDKKHHVSFQKEGQAYFCSEPTAIERVDLETTLSNAFRLTAVDAPLRTAEQFFEETAERLLLIYEPDGDNTGIRRASIARDTRQLRGRRSPAEFAGLIARTLFDTELLVMPKPT